MWFLGLGVVALVVDDHDDGRIRRVACVFLERKPSEQTREFQRGRVRRTV
jgi:hypothetical protein